MRHSPPRLPPCQGISEIDRQRTVAAAAGTGQIGPSPECGAALVAEADGNRTRQRRGTPLTGCEDRPPLETTIPVTAPEGSSAQVTAGSTGTCRDGAGSLVH